MAVAAVHRVCFLYRAFVDDQYPVCSPVTGMGGFGYFRYSWLFPNLVTLAALCVIH